ncbi:MAG TPA: histidine kinase [Gemmatimonadales bacterium]|nr:histidine kinase [Gemmatimonadales bacterium]
MSTIDRVALASRAFCVAALLGLSLATADSNAIQSMVVLSAVSLAAAAVDGAGRLPTVWITTFEALIVGLLIGLALPEGLLLLPYLVVPALLAGLRQGVGAVLLAAMSETAALAISLLIAGVPATTAPLAETIVPWLITATGLGMLGVWVSQLKSGGPPVAASDPTYEAARRLLSQLRTVARQLSSGLDTGSMAATMLTSVSEELPVTRSAAFVMTEGGILAPIGYSSSAARADCDSADPVVTLCWHEMEPRTRVSASGETKFRYRTALPLRVGPRMIGVVIADTPQAPGVETTARLMVRLDDLSLRLDTALIFDEVRSIATQEERQRLAREIHDSVAQEVASLGYAIDGLVADALSEDQRRRLRELRTEVTRVVGELRHSIFDLRSEVSASGGLGSALSDYVRQIGTRSDMTVHLTLDEAPTRLRNEIETELLRIAQEAITNARKHSGAKNLWVDCRVQPPFARIEVRDDGTGAAQARPDSYGLRIMRERAQRIDGILHVRDDSDGARGTVVVVTVGSEPAAIEVPHGRTDHVAPVDHHGAAR